MKINEVTQREGYEDNPAHRKLASLGRTLMDMAAKEKDDEMSNNMAKLGDALTRYGTTFGPRNPQELMKTTGLSGSTIKDLLGRASEVGEIKPKGNDVPDEPEADDDMNGPSDDEIARQADRRARGR